MSVFDLPRLHFFGVATTKLPTGARSGLVDLATNTALTDEGPFPAHRPAQEYHDYLDRHGTRFDAAGRVTDKGSFSALKGWNFGGNGHFWIDAKIVSVEVSAGCIDRVDAVVGRDVDMWGHYNEYLATTVNRARIFDVDPSSNWTTTLMVGQFGFGRAGRSHDVGYMLTGDVHGLHPPRWHNVNHILDVGDHYLAPQLRRSTLYQFVVPDDEGLNWLGEAAVSPAVTLLRATMDSDGVDGLVVQFTLSNMSTPLAPDTPIHWELWGTIAPWRAGELRTYPAGRLLTPSRARAGLHNLTVELTPDHVTFNMINAVPATCRAEHSGPGPTHQLGPLLDVGDLELRTAGTDRLVAAVPRQAYLGDDYTVTSGIVTVPTAFGVAGDQTLCLVGTDSGGNRVVLLSEQEINLQVDDACLILDHPKDGGDPDHDVEVPVRSFVRGRPCAVDAVTVRQFFNPKALPLDEVARSAQARCGDIEIVRLRAGELGDSGDWSGTCTIRTDEQGHGAFTIRGARAGSTRILLSAHPDHTPGDVTQLGSAVVGYDEDDVLGFWPGAGALSVRVLPNDWWLDDIPQQDVTFDLVYQEIFAFYELLSSFMSAEVFSLADRFRVQTYARLIWQMCDPRNKTKTYYMPPTRDLSEPKAQLLLKFLRAQNTASGVPSIISVATRTDRGITTRSELVPVLRQAATIELAVMLQYLYAAYSIPTYGAGLEYLRRGEWTFEQLRLVCGDGGKTLDKGIRSSLLAVAREEMIHFLLVNNIIMAVGEPFHIPSIDFGTINHQLPVPLDFSLEPLGVGSMARFIAIEQPADLVGELSREGITSSGSGGADHTYSSLSELYANIRDGLQRVPDLFLVDKGRGGGEHHLFLRESINVVHPDYQLEVDDLASALFAIDVITEQGEGNVLTSVTSRDHGEESHFDTFLRISDLLMAEQIKGAPSRRAPWSPAYPVVRNPTLHQGNPAQELVTDPEAREVLQLFNRSYFMMLQLMVQHFGQCPDASLRRSALMNMAIEVMTGVMRPLAELLVTLPSGRRGKTAGPSFELDSRPEYTSRPDVACRAIALRFAHLAAAARKCSPVSTQVAETLEFMADFFRSANRVNR
ncbi:MAG TPA: ferritin-like domain-containing protein [Pseudonocardiaceae bacterium]|nr:ferritin-like domain-containing protein [Pseudonocardiaceae bacterium]